MKRRIDAPIAPILLASFGLIGLYIAWTTKELSNYIFPGILLICAALYLYASLRGKYIVIQETVESLKIPSHSQVLDLGTGHGAVLLEVAKHLKQPGKVVGIDIWKSGDQAHNSMDETQQIINQSNVASVAELKTEDMSELSFADQSFDYIFASLSIHNVKPTAKRIKAIKEAGRVLKQDGQLVIIDIEHITEYARVLKSMNFKNIKILNTGINGMYGIMQTKVLIAQK